MAPRDEAAGGTRLWGGRFTEAPAPALLAFTESLSFDRLLAYDDARILAAHTRALARAGLLAPGEAEAVSAELEQIVAEIQDDTFVFEQTDEDIHTAVERALITRLPDAGARSRAGLSRNDRVAAAFRLWCVRELRALGEQVCDLAAALVMQAEQSRDVIMPGYTHLQRAQPIRLAHHLLAHVHALLRDTERLRDAAARASASPLGAGALAGTTLGVDAAAISAELGFERTLSNSIDAVSARDFAAEALCACAILAVDCSRIGEEIVLWTSAEFGFAELSDAYSTGSSLMPQKKNPDVAELTRAKAGRAIGNLTGLLAMLKGLPLAYNRDLQEDKEPVFDTVRQMSLMLHALTGLIQTITFDREAMSRAAGQGGLLATDLAEYLVTKGMPFRAAHEIVGLVVRRALSQGKDLGELSIDELRASSDSFGPEVADVLSARASVERRDAPGPSARSVAAQLDEVHAAVVALREQLRPGTKPA